MNDDDPIISYFIVRESLNMSIGKIPAQVGHCVQFLMTKYFKDAAAHVADLNSNNFRIDLYPDYLSTFETWLDTRYCKVILTASDKEWDKIKNLFVEGETRFTVIDDGLTELVSGSETVIGLWPMYKSQVPKLIKRLQTLK